MTHDKGTAGRKPVAVVGPYRRALAGLAHPPHSASPPSRD
jgi:hypothetical protein